MKRYPELTALFSRLEVDVGAALSMVVGINVNEMSPPPTEDVQKGIVG